MYRNIIIGLLLSGCISSIVTSEEETTSTIDGSTVKTGGSVCKKPDTSPPFNNCLATPEVHPITLRVTERSITRSQPVTRQGQTGARHQIEHRFSEAVIIVIIFAVMAVIISIILLLAHGIRKLRERSAVTIQTEFPQSADEPLSSVETGNPEQ